jgi:16S rRNA (uracil1498-N3)-methyltransferase
MSVCAMGASFTPAMSGSIRLFVEAALAAGAEIAATAGQAHYLGSVMRRAAGDPVHLFNGRDGEWQARITAVRRDKATLLVQSQIRPQAAEPDPWLVFALLKRDATDMVVQKATELGAAALLPVFTERTNAGRANIARLVAIAIEAAEQSERLTVPTIQEPQPLPALLAGWPPERRLFVAAERSDTATLLQARLVPLPPSAPSSGSSQPGWVRPPGMSQGSPLPEAAARPFAATALLVGPEGGFSAAELDGLQAHAFVTPISLGPRILRAETAAIAGLALLQTPVSGL